MQPQLDLPGIAITPEALDLAQALLTPAMAPALAAAFQAEGGKGTPCVRTVRLPMAAHAQGDKLPGRI